MIHFTIYDLLGILAAAPFLVLYYWLTRTTKVPYEGRRGDAKPPDRTRQHVCVRCGKLYVCRGRKA